MPWLVFAAVCANKFVRLSAFGLRQMRQLRQKKIGVRVRVRVQMRVKLDADEKGEADEINFLQGVASTAYGDRVRIMGRGLGIAGLMGEGGLRGRVTE